MAVTITPTPMGNQPKLNSEPAPKQQIAASEAASIPSGDNSTHTEETSAPKLNTAQEAFARKERQIRKMQQELQLQKQALEAKQKSYETDYVPKSKLKDEFWSVAEELGLDYDTLTQQMLTQPNDPATKALMGKIKALEQKQSQSEQMEVERQKQAYEAAKTQISNQVKMLVDSDPEFEMLKNSDMADEVVSRIEDKFNEDGVLMDVKEACTIVENELIEDMIRLSQLAKVQARLKPKTEIPPEQSKQQPAQGVKTLSQSMEQKPTSKLSQKDRIARAMAAFNGNLT
jgi:hypothetical protein